MSQNWFMARKHVMQSKGWTRCHEANGFVFGYVTPQSEMDIEYRLARTRYVLANDWLTIPHGEPEQDRYDNHLDTTITMMVDAEANKVVAWMRATQVRSVEDSLTFSMLDGTVPGCRNGVEEIKDIQAELNFVLGNGGTLYDVTRLVPNDEYFAVEDKLEKIDRLRRFRANVGGMIGLIIGMTAALRPDPYECRFMFLGDLALSKLLHRNNFQHETISIEPLSTADKGPLRFGWGSPVDAVNSDPALRAAKDAGITAMRRQQPVASTG